MLKYPLPPTFVMWESFISSLLLLNRTFVLAADAYRLGPISVSCKRALRLKDTLQLTGKLEINCVMMPHEDKEPAILLNYNFIHMG